MPPVTVPIDSADLPTSPTVPEGSGSQISVEALLGKLRVMPRASPLGRTVKHLQAQIEMGMEVEMVVDRTKGGLGVSRVQRAVLA